MDQNLFYQCFGFAGIEFITDTQQHNGRFTGFYVVEAAVINVMDEVKNSGSSLSSPGVTIPAGTYVYMPFRQIKLTSGKIIAYWSALPFQKFNELISMAPQ